MRRLRIVLATLLAAAGVGVLAGPPASATSRPASVCDDYQKALEKGVADTNFNPSRTRDLTDLKQTYKDVAKLYKSLEKKGPKELRSSFKVLRKWAEKISKIDFNDPSSASKVFSSSDSKDLVKATEKITRYITKKCGIDITKLTLPTTTGE